MSIYRLAAEMYEQIALSEESLQVLDSMLRQPCPQNLTDSSKNDLIFKIYEDYKRIVLVAREVLAARKKVCEVLVPILLNQQMQKIAFPECPALVAREECLATTYNSARELIERAKITIQMLLQ